MEGGQACDLKDVCIKITDGTHNSPKYVSHGVPMLDSKHIGEDFYIDGREAKKFISRETDVELSQRCKPAKDDVLISSRGSIGKIAVVREGQDFNIMGNIILLRPSERLVSKYLAYALMSKVEYIQSISKGVAQKGLYLNQVRNFKISVPEIHKQQRIVAILDEAFAGISTATANADKNLQNAHELFESYLNNIFTQDAGNWKKYTLSQLCDFENGDRGKNYPNKSALVSNGIPFVNAGHVSDGIVSLESMNFITKERYDLLGSGKFTPGDILFCLRGSLGKFGVVGDDVGGGAIASSLVIVRPKAKENKVKILSGFLVNYFRSRICSDMIEKYAGGAAQPNLGARDLAKFEINLPSLDEQESYVSRLNEYRDETMRLERVYEQKLALLSELKQSILQKAFAGELR